MLKGKKILITGANRGIGKAILEKFAQNGADIFAHARQETKEFVELTSSLSKKYNICINNIYFDLRDTEKLKNEIKQLILNKEKVDVLVNSAGIIHYDFFQMMPISKIRDIFEIDLFAHMEITQLILKLMIRQNRGNIINISSIAALDMKPGNCAYGAVKSAMIVWTKSLASECAKYNIRVNAIAPGLTDTDLGNSILARNGDQILKYSAMNRFGKPEEIANVVLFLASDDSSFVNGEVIRVDGGIL